jgi:hypothetical protein
VTSFRRAGVEFSASRETVVNRSDITAAQATELLNTPHLQVEELTTESKDAVQPVTRERRRGEGPDPASLRDPGDVPVPTPQGPIGGDQHVGPAVTTPPSRPAPSSDREGAPPRDTMNREQPTPTKK